MFVWVRKKMLKRGHFEYLVSIWSGLVFQGLTKQMFSAEPNILWKKKLSGMIFRVVMKVSFVLQLPHEEKRKRFDGSPNSRN